MPSRHSVSDGSAHSSCSRARRSPPPRSRLSQQARRRARPAVHRDPGLHDAHGLATRRRLRRAPDRSRVRDALGRGQRKAPLSTAVIALTTTALVYVPAASSALRSWNGDRFVAGSRLPPGFGGLIDLVYGRASSATEPAAVLVFLGGLGRSSSRSSSSTPRAGPRRASVESRPAGFGRSGRCSGWAAPSRLSMSVSVALTILVPLVAKNYVRRDSSSRTSWERTSRRSATRSSPRSPSTHQAAIRIMLA